MKYSIKIAVLLFLITSCSVVFARQDIRVGVFENKPIVFKADNGVISGLSIDVIEEIAVKEQWAIEYVYGSFKETFKKLKNNEIDLIVGLAYTEERAKNLFYTKETLLNNWGVVYQPISGNAISIEDLQNKRVAMMEKNIHSRVFDSLMMRFGFSYTPVYVSSPSELFRVLKSEAADAGVINRLASLNITRKDNIKPTSIIFNPVEVRYASSKNNNNIFVDTIDKYLRVWKKNESSFYYQQLDKWINIKSTYYTEWMTHTLIFLGVISVCFLLYIVYIQTIVKRSQKKLDYKATEQSVILESLADGAIIIDEKGTVRSFNKAAEKMFLCPRKDVVGKNISMLMPEPDSSRHDGYLENYLIHKERNIIDGGREVTGKRINNELFPMRLSVSELPIEEGGVHRFIGTCVDLTIQKQQDKYMQRSQKMDALGQLTGGIAHDYNNMLGVVLGFTELINENLDDDSRLKIYAEQILKAANRGVSLTKKLLTFSRNTHADREIVNLNDMLREEVLMLEKTLTPRIKLVLDLGENLFSVCVDRSELIESVVNMSINAMHAMTDGGKFIIKTCNKDHADDSLRIFNARRGDYVCLSLIDNGSGMTDEQQLRIFEPFYSTKGDAGNGLGMSQVYGFVTEQGGAIDVVSKIGLGTCIDIYLPAYKNDEANAVTTETEGLEPKPIEEKIVLVVDDEESIPSMVKEMTVDGCYTVLTASSGKEAIEIIKSRHVDLLLSDIIMPDMDGYALAKAVLKNFPALKIQFMSGFNDIKGKHGVPEELLKNVLQKPFSLQQLMKKIDSHFTH